MPCPEQPFQMDTPPTSAADIPNFDASASIKVGFVGENRELTLVPSGPEQAELPQSHLPAHEPNLNSVPLLARKLFGVRSLIRRPAQNPEVIQSELAAPSPSRRMIGPMTRVFPIPKKPGTSVEVRPANMPAPRREYCPVSEAATTLLGRIAEQAATEKPSPTPGAVELRKSNLPTVAGLFVSRILEQARNQDNDRSTASQQLRPVGAPKIPKSRFRTGWDGSRQTSTE